MNRNKLYEMSKKYKTPLYVFDGDKIRDTYYMMRDALEKRVEIFFSVKANPTLAVCQILKNAGSSIEVASKGELHLALAAGFDSHNIIFSGPGKLKSEIEFAIESDIAALIAESFEEVNEHREITMVLNGFSCKQHIDEAVNAVKDLEEKSMDEIQCIYDKGLNVNNPLCTGCGYCSQCPKGIEIPKFMDAYNEKILGASIITRLRKHWRISANEAKKCVKCRKCEQLCTQHLPIVDRMQEIAEVIK